MITFCTLWLLSLSCLAVEMRRNWYYSGDGDPFDLYDFLLLGGFMLFTLATIIPVHWSLP